MDLWDLLIMKVMPVCATVCFVLVIAVLIKILFAL